MALSTPSKLCNLTTRSVTDGGYLDSDSKVKAILALLVSCLQGLPRFDTQINLMTQ